MRLTNTRSICVRSRRDGFLLSDMSNMFSLTRSESDISNISGPVLIRYLEHVVGFCLHNPERGSDARGAARSVLIRYLEHVVKLCLQHIRIRSDQISRTYQDQFWSDISNMFPELKHCSPLDAVSALDFLEHVHARHLCAGL